MNIIKKYLLLDKLYKGFYIIDMETKCKVVICDEEVAKPDIGHSKVYGIMLKLYDEHIVRMYSF